MTDVPDVDGLVSELRARVEQRTREGHYPAELTEEMRQHFQRIAAHRAAVDLDVLRRQLDVLDNASTFDASRIPLDSSAPGGQKLHAAVAKLVSRQTQGALEQVQAFADATRVALRTILLALEEPHGHVHADLVGQVDSLFERLAAFERGARPDDAPTDPGPEVDPADLADAPDESAGAVTVADMAVDALVDLAVLARRKLQPGGRLVVEGSTAAPHPAYVEFVLRAAGFGDVRTEWGDRPPADGASIKRLLSAPEGYTVVATR